MEFLLASSNKHKAQEFEFLSKGSSLTILPSGLKIEVEENGESYFENAQLKAEAYYKKFKKPILADDSGLNVLALPEDLGIFSARFGGEGLTDKERALLLLDRMKEVKEKDREAFFSCILCFYRSPSEIFFFEGRMQGKIGFEYQGEHGFGYDPVFIPEKGEGKMLAELPEFKQSYSHRAIAIKEAIAFFERGYCQKAQDSL